MTVKEMIELLKTFPQDAIVYNEYDNNFWETTPHYRQVIAWTTDVQPGDVFSGESQPIDMNVRVDEGDTLIKVVVMD